MTLQLGVHSRMPHRQFAVAYGPGDGIFSAIAVHNPGAKKAAPNITAAAGIVRH
jgi:hypothetical protein